jgi:hypothetical protein
MTGVFVMAAKSVLTNILGGGILGRIFNVRKNVYGKV